MLSREIPAAQALPAHPLNFVRVSVVLSKDLNEVLTKKGEDYKDAQRF